MTVRLLYGLERLRASPKGEVGRVSVQVVKGRLALAHIRVALIWI